MQSRTIRLNAKLNVASIVCGFSALLLTTLPLAAMGRPAKGEQLAAQHCNSCHSVSRSDSVRMADAGPQFAELAKKPAGYLHVAINKPHDFMPKFPQLSKQDKDDLIAYIRNVK